MKVLIVGIDGGDSRIIKGMDMPFLQKLANEGSERVLREDLYSRGWSEIISGCQAPDAKNMYMWPKLDGSHDFSFSYNTEDLKTNPGVVPMWDMVAEMGYTMGIMNVPTTAPACPVNGFMVSGGGGGLDSAISGIPEALVYPKELKTDLDNEKYILDLRLGPSGIEDWDTFMDQLDSILEMRASSFLKCVERKPVDVGFVCFRVTTDIQYLAMTEIEAILAHRSMPEVAGRNSHEEAEYSDIQQRIINHYKLLDKQIERIFKKLEPEHFVVTSDHGASSYKFDVCIDSLLEEHGYLVSKSGHTDIRGLVRKFIHNYIPRNLIKSVKEKTPQKIVRMVFRFDPKKTRAFGYTYMNGVYINDSKRFNGPVSDQHELDRLVDEIIEIINKDERSRPVALEARAYRRHYFDSPFYDYLPDIQILHNGECFFRLGNSFISRNKKYAPISKDLSKIRGDMNSGQKSPYPLFIVDHKTAKQISDINTNDLRLVFQTVKTILTD